MVSSRWIGLAALGIALLVAASLFLDREAAPAGAGDDAFQWSGRDAPAVAEADGRAVLVGLIRRREGPDLHVHVAAFDADGLDPLWETPSLGEMGVTEPHVHIAAGAGRVIVATPDAELALFDLVTGALAGEVVLSAMAVSVCVPPGAGSAWVAVSDGHHVTVDLASGRATPGRRPHGCPDPGIDRPRCRGGAFHGAECLGGSSLPAVEGVRNVAGLSRGAHAAAYGHFVGRGASTPVVLGFDPSDGWVSWQRPLQDIHPDVSEERAGIFDVADDRVWIQIERYGGQRRLIAFDLERGDPVLDVPLPGEERGAVPAAFRVHGGRVYLPLGTRLHILDASTGDPLGALGCVC